MRIRLSLGRSLFFLCAFLFALVALLPLRFALDWLALDERGFAARETKGSLWLGAISEAQWGGVALGDLQARLRTLPLLALRARIDIDSLDAPKRVDGGITVTRNSFGIDDMTARIEAAGLFAPLPVSALDLSDLTVRYANGACAAADGTIIATVSAVAGLPLPPQLSGAARCDAGTLLLPLQSAGGSEKIDIRLDPDGRCRARISLLAVPPGAAPALSAAGFQATAAGYVLDREGRF